MSNSDAKYEQMRGAGASPEEIFRQVLADGLGDVAAIRTVRVLFGLDLRQAKEVLIQARGWAASLEEYQNQIADWIEQYREDKGDRSE
jgi:ribosomal protein L7/L12